MNISYRVGGRYAILLSMNKLFKTVQIEKLDWNKLKPAMADQFEEAKKPKKYRRTSTKVV
jgi:hypothetical protein